MAVISALHASDCVGRTIDERFTLLRWLGGTDQNSVFLTELEGHPAQKAVIKLSPADAPDGETRIVQWEAARTLSHPHLMRLFHTGRCEDSPPYHVNGNGSHNKLRFVDLFCGIGGFRIAFERAGCECVFSSDWNEKARETYQANFGEEPHGDIHSIAVADIPKHDILCAGFPCQPFSIAGVSKKLSLGRAHGFDDKEQGNLFFTLADIIDFHQPEAFVLENVKNLKSHDQGRTFQIIHDTLTNALGYTVYHKIIDAQSVVPQHRERIFLVGFKERRGFEFPQFPAEGPKLASISTGKLLAFAA